MHPYCLHNDSLREVGEKVLSPGQVGLLSGWGVFSTLRVYDGVLFAFERHWARMTKDAQLLRVPMPRDPEGVRSKLLELVRANDAANATLRVVIVRNRGGIFEGPNNREFDLVAFTAPLKNWGPGVSLAVQPQARHSGCMFAGTKILSWALNLAWLEEVQCRGFDEVVLLNERGEISECTSANLFVSQQDRVWTPPLGSGCLPGVTREVILGLDATGVSVEEKALRPADLERADEVFITSTTRHLLPVLSIEGLRIRNSGFARGRLEQAFLRYVDSYVV